MAIDELIAFTDGACRGNGSPNARAAYAVCWPDFPEHDAAHMLSGEEGSRTNNRAELMAIIHAFRTADKIDPHSSKTLVVYTDSMLAINSLTLWMEGWKRRNWRKSDGQMVANVDLLELLDEYMKARPCTFKHVMAHTKNKDWASIWNAKVDKCANAALDVSIPGAC